MTLSINPHHLHTKPFITHPTPLESLPTPEYPMKRFFKQAGDTVTLSAEDATSGVAAIGKYPTYGLPF